MPSVELRWRPSGGSAIAGGRGEYEHVPSDVLMDRRIVVDPGSGPEAIIFTDVHGRWRNGKPRLRRDDGNDRSMLNVANLAAALDLLPDPRRSDQGTLILPLRDNGYVISSISFDVTYDGDGVALCAPLKMQVLHDPSVIDLAERLNGVRAMIVRDDLPSDLADLAMQYKQLIAKGIATAEFRVLSAKFREALEAHPDIRAELDAPSLEVEPDGDVVWGPGPTVEDLSADETKRRLVSHYKIDRDRSIVRKKVARFKAEHGDVYCEACLFSFGETYGESAKEVIDVHHIRPLASLLPNTLTRLSDLMLLCPNCHRVVHRKRTPLEPAELISLLEQAKANKQT